MSAPPACERSDTKAQSKRRSTHVPIEPNLIKFDIQSDFGATAGSDGVLASNLIREAGSNNFRQENVRSEFKNSVQIEKL